MLIAVLLGVAALPALLHGRSLEQALVSTFPAVLRSEGAGLGEVLARTVAASFPVTGTSSSYVYEFDPANDSFEKQTMPLGPVFSERANPVGAGKLSVALNYLFIELDELDGRDLDALVSNDPSRPGDHIAICAGAFCEPVLGTIGLDLEAQILALSLTYGLTPDLDANLFLPFVRTFLRASTRFTGPDPRAPPREDFFSFAHESRVVETDEGIGDLLVRVRYLLARPQLADVAAGLALSIPTGSESSFHGTGDPLITPALYFSRLYRQRFQPHVNLGLLLNAGDAERSEVRYSAGADLRVFDWFTMNGDFLGRSEVARPDEVEQPVFLPAERRDVLQLSIGFKTAPFRRGPVLLFNTLLPLNDDGVRADVVLLFGIEAAF